MIAVTKEGPTDLRPFIFAVLVPFSMRTLPVNIQESKWRSTDGNIPIDVQKVGGHYTHGTVTVEIEK